MAKRKQPDMEPVNVEPIEYPPPADGEVWLYLLGLTDREISVANELSAKNELSLVQTMRQALRLYEAVSCGTMKCVDSNRLPMAQKAIGSEQHTPRPWNVSSQNGDALPGFQGLVGVVGPEQTNAKGHKFTMYVAQYIKPEDADMIAAAPELVESCQSLLALVCDLEILSPNANCVRHTAVKRQASVAIAKARGTE